jgi:hypothetical protein
MNRQQWQDEADGHDPKKSVIDDTQSSDSSRSVCSSIMPEDILLPYYHWVDLVKRKRGDLPPEEIEWLCRWEMWDLANSPMDDGDRRNIRYGHYLGWFHFSNPKLSGRRDSAASDAPKS